MNYKLPIKTQTIFAFITSIFGFMKQHANKKSHLAVINLFKPFLAIIPIL